MRRTLIALLLIALLPCRALAEGGILPQYQDWYDKNSDMIGWIRIDGTKLDDPVMQTLDDPEYYLNRNFEREEDDHGLPFLDSWNDLAQLPTQNLVVFAHNMKDGTRFGAIKGYQSQRFWRTHQYIQFDLLREQRTYQVIAAFQGQEYDSDDEGFRYYQYNDLSERERFDDFMARLSEARLYDTGLTAEFGDELLTLSTCSYHVDHGSFVVVARRVVAPDLPTVNAP